MALPKGSDYLAVKFYLARLTYYRILDFDF